MIRLPMSENRIVPSWSIAPPSVNEPSPQTFSSFAAGSTTLGRIGLVLKKGNGHCHEEGCDLHG